MTQNGAEAASQLVRRMRTGARCAVVGHVDPDPDSIGSVLALHRLFQRMGIESLAITPDPVPVSLSFLPGVDEFVLPHELASLEGIDLWVLDCGLERTGRVRELASTASHVVNVDHHATNTGTGTHNWVDARYAACALMVYELAEAAGVVPDAEMATLLYAGIAGDTGTFRFSNTSAQVLHIAATLVERGADPAYIASMLYERRSLGFLKLLGSVLMSVDTACDGRVIHATVTDADRARAQISSEEGQGIIQYLRMVGSVPVAVLFDQIDPGQVKIQFRSGPEVDVAAVAATLGGGGHPRAAGCRLPGDVASIRLEVLRRLQQALDEQQ